jgi:transposase
LGFGNSELTLFSTQRDERAVEAEPNGGRELPHAEISAGEAQDNRLAGKLLSRLKAGSMLLADRGYDADWIRALAASKGALANIPPRCNRNDPICFSPYLYRAPNLVERFFNKIKHCRRVATRCDKLAANYLAFVQLEAIRLWLRVNESTS